jgi:hypothetical protein
MNGSGKMNSVFQVERTANKLKGFRLEDMSKTFPTPYPELNSVLQDLVESVQTVLSIKFVGAYLQGSFAVGDFDLHSDVDFIMVTEEDLSEEEVHGLQGAHERIYCLDSPWAQHLEGSYFPREILWYSAQSGGQLWYLNHGSRSLIQSDHCNNRFYQGYIVLNYCRMLHDLHRGFPGSKLAGAQWAKANLDPSWQGLIDRAWNGRPDPAVSSRESADPQDFKATLEFLHYCRNKANT